MYILFIYMNSNYEMGQSPIHSRISDSNIYICIRICILIYMYMYSNYEMGQSPIHSRISDSNYEMGQSPIHSRISDSNIYVYLTYTCPILTTRWDKVPSTAESLILTTRWDKVPSTAESLILIHIRISMYILPIYMNSNICISYIYTCPIRIRHEF